jgi:hypothetical protein
MSVHNCKRRVLCYVLAIVSVTSKQDLKNCSSHAVMSSDCLLDILNYTNHLYLMVLSYFYLKYNLLQWLLVAASLVEMAVQQKVMLKCKLEIKLIIIFGLSCHFWKSPHKIRTERRGPVVGTPASYSGGPAFKSRPGGRLSWLTFPVVFLIPLRQMPGYYLTLGHDCFLPYPFQFIIPFIIQCYSLSYLQHR